MKGLPLALVLSVVWPLEELASGITVGEWQLMAWLVMSGSPVYPLIHEDFRGVTLDSLVAMMPQ